MTEKYRVVLTGGVASGKTTAADYFRRWGVDVVDADAIAREVVTQGSDTLKRIVTEFGDEILTPEGGLDRARLRLRVFNDPEQRQRLEAILHPLIREHILWDIEHSNSPYVIADIPLYAESSSKLKADRVLVIDAPPALQIQRLHQRNNLSRDEALAVIAAQAERVLRISIADDMICNDSDMKTFADKLALLHADYLDAAKNMRHQTES